MIQLFRPKYRTEEILEEIRDTLNSGWTGDGPKCQRFQKEMEQFIGARDGSVRFLNSATSALHLAVRALDLPDRSQIGTTPITFVSTNAAILYEHHHPYFIDIDPETLSIDPDLVWDLVVAKDIKGLIWVHYAGSVHPDFIKISEELSRWGITVIEDCAHAMGAFYPNTNRRVGSLPHTISCFSFQAVKNLPTSDSGAIVVPDPEMFERVNRLSWLGIDKSTYQRTGGADLYKWKYSVPELGWKYNPNDIMACIALTQLKYVDQDNAYRKQVHDWYKESFKDSRVRMITHNPGSSYHLVEVVVDNRELIMTKLRESGYATGVHYLPNNEFEAFAQFHRPLPETNRIAEKILTLPTHLDLKKHQIDEIARIVAEYA